MADPRRERARTGLTERLNGRADTGRSRVGSLHPDEDIWTTALDVLVMVGDSAAVDALSRPDDDQIRAARMRRGRGTTDHANAASWLTCRCS